MKTLSHTSTQLEVLELGVEPKPPGVPLTHTGSFRSPHFP